MHSGNEEDHLRQLEVVLKLLMENQLYTKASKCSSMQTEIDYLGHIMSSEGVKTDPQKVKAITCWP